MPSFRDLAVAAVLAAVSVSADTTCSYANTDYHCALKGTLTKPTVLRTFASKTGDMTSCRDTCLSISACVTFGFDSVTKQCGMYTQVLNSQGWRADSKSTTTFWSYLCFSKTCSSVPATSSTAGTGSPGGSETTPTAGSGVTPDPDSSLTVPVDPNATPADPSAFTATYTFFEGQLPTFTDAVPTLAAVQTQVPAPVCLTDPSNPNIKFEILNGKGIPLVYQGGNPAKLGLLTNDQAKPSYLYPQYHFEKPVGAPAGYYDLVLEDPKNGNLFLARDASGNILLSKKSSKGQTLTKIDNQNVVTTIWTASCDGRMAVGTTTTQYVWAVSGLYTVAQTGDASAAKPFILIAKTTTSSKNKKRNEYQDGAYHRCIEQPRPLVADTAVTPKRPAQSNGCGSGSTAAWVPDLDFGHCCDGHDLCYDNCAGGFKDKCDDTFLDCMNKSCEDDLGTIGAYLSGCYKVAQFYHDVVAGIGGDAFVSSTTDRCQCYCEDRANNQLCSVNNAPACVFVKGSDNNNCGGCGQKCPSYAHCGTGTCHCNQDTCGGGLCLSLLNHPRNCGSCGNVCASGYCYQGHCYDPPPPTPTFCPLKDAITDGGFSSWNLNAWTVTDTGSGNYHSYGVGGDEGHGPDASFIASAWPVTISQDVVVCPGNRYTFTMGAYSWSGGCSVKVLLAGHQILQQSLAVRQHDADLPAAVGPATISIDANDGAFKAWGVSRNATLSVSFSCGGYATVYADDITLYVTN